MGALERITITLPKEMLAEIKRAIEAGEFIDTSEAIRAALRHWRRARTAVTLNDEELRRLLAEGEAALKRLRANYAAPPRTIGSVDIESSSRTRLFSKS